VVFDGLNADCRCGVAFARLNETLFSTLAEAREKIGAWKEDYNRHRPHSSLGNLTELALRQ
jgi:transposase InsO family protein